MAFMFYAVIASGGKQYKVSEGDILEIDKISGKKDDKIKLDQVLLVVSEGNVRIGSPTVTGAEVIAKYLKEVKGDKIRVAKFKAKAKYRRAVGFRAQKTMIQIETIKVSEKKEEKNTAKATPKKAK